MSWSVISALVVALVFGCGGRHRVAGPRGGEALAAIVIEGNRALATDTLVPGLAIERARAAGRGLDPYQLSVDTSRIRAAYLRHGFFEVVVTARVDTPETAPTVVFTVDEGRRATLQVTISGLPPEVPFAKARTLIAAKDGSPFDYETYDLAKQPLVALVENAGYPKVTVDAAVLADRVHAIATARFIVSPGPAATFGEVTITGTDGQLADAVRARLRFRSGDRYQVKAIEESQRAIYDLGRFATVRIEPDRDAGAVVPVRIVVSPATRHEVRAGGGGGLDPASILVRARIGGSTVPKMHPLWTLAGDFRPGVAFQREGGEAQAKIRALFTATRLDLFRPQIRGELEASADYITVEAYTSTGPRFRAGISAPLGAPWLQARAGWVIEYLWFRDPKIDEPVRGALGLDEPQRRGAYELSVSADGRDNQIEPRLGVLVSLRAAYGTPLAGGAGTYTQLTPEVRGYVPIGRVVLAGRLRLGAIYGDAPVTERYYSGGSTTQRGFADRRLSPVAAGTIGGDPGQVVIGGVGSIETGLELRIPIGEFGVPFGIEVFLDGGDVTETIAALEPGNLHWAAGLGVYLKVFGLKFRADLGYRLNRTGPTEAIPADSTWARLSPHLGIGDTF